MTFKVIKIKSESDKWINQLTKTLRKARNNLEHITIYVDLSKNQILITPLFDPKQFPLTIIFQDHNLLIIYINYRLFQEDIKLIENLVYNFIVHGILKTTEQLVRDLLNRPLPPYTIIEFRI